MSRFHNLGQRLAASDPNDDIEDEIDPSATPLKSNKKEADMSETNNAEAIATAKKEGREEGIKSAHDRMTAVFASDHYAGREAMAAKLLGKPNMTAEDIVDVLADTPKANPSGLSEDQGREAAEEAGRKEMRQAIEGGKNSNIDADAGNGDGKKSDPAAAGGIWDKAIARVFPGKAK